MRTQYDHAANVNVVAEQPTGGIPTAVGDLREQVDGLEKALDALFNGLTGVLVPPGPELSEHGEVPKADPASPVAEELGKIARQVHHLAEKARRHIDRLDI